MGKNILFYPYKAPRNSLGIFKIFIGLLELAPAFRMFSLVACMCTYAFLSNLSRSSCVSACKTQVPSYAIDVPGNYDTSKDINLEFCEVFDKSYCFQMF